MTGLSAISGLVITGSAFAVLMVSLSLVRSRLEAEWRRKLFHVGAGLIAVSLPWLLPARWCALVLVAATIAVLLVVRLVARLRSTLGSALHDIGRRSYGEFYFGVAVLALFLFAPHGGIRYEIPVLILTLADPMAALVGMAYGRHHLGGWSGSKTVEGSLACMTIAWVVTALGLAAGGHGPFPTLVIATVVAAAGTAAEALGSAGSDNLLIPLATYLVLRPLLAPPFIFTLSLTTLVVAIFARVTLGLLAPRPTGLAPTAAQRQWLGNSERPRSWAPRSRGALPLPRGRCRLPRRGSDEAAVAVERAAFAE